MVEGGEVGVWLECVTRLFWILCMCCMYTVDMTAWCWASEVEQNKHIHPRLFCGPSFALRPIPQVSGYRTPPHRGPPVWHSTDEGVNQMANSEAQHQVAFGAKGLPACAAWCSYSEILNNNSSPCPTPNFHTTPSDAHRCAANALHRACLPASHARGAWRVRRCWSRGSCPR